MRFKAKHDAAPPQPDMTPMIDMVFQLIAFFMVVINFTKVDQSELISLPSSELAKPAEEPVKWPITIQLTKDAEVLCSGEKVPIAGLRRLLKNERRGLTAEELTPQDVTIIIRADENAKTGHVQQIIRVAQETKFENFVLRAKSDFPVKKD
jgi:biopolymer transport protein ExbD